MPSLRPRISRVDAMLSVKASGVGGYQSGEAQANEDKGLENVHGWSKLMVARTVLKREWGTDYRSMLEIVA